MEYNSELYHHGIKGMRWGVRRYRNKDGTLTEAGKRRYAIDARDKEYDKQDERGTYYKTNNKGKNRQDLKFDADRYVTEDMQRTKRVIDDGALLAGRLKNVSDKSIRNQKRERLDLSKISDKELRDKINRELLERQYNDVFNPPKISKGKENASKILETTGDVLVVLGSAVGLALSIKELLIKT